MTTSFCPMTDRELMVWSALYAARLAAVDGEPGLRDAADAAEFATLGIEHLQDLAVAAPASRRELSDSALASVSQVLEGSGASGQQELFINGARALMARKAAGFSIPDACDHLGVRAADLQLVEQGLSRIRQDRLKLMAELYEVTSLYLSTDGPADIRTYQAAKRR